MKTSRRDIRRAVWNMPSCPPPPSYFVLFKNLPRSSTGKARILPINQRHKKLLRN